MAKTNVIYFARKKYVNILFGDRIGARIEQRQPPNMAADTPIWSIGRLFHQGYVAEDTLTFTAEDLVHMNIRI
jgi:hypothetical protein